MIEDMGHLQDVLARLRQVWSEADAGDAHYDLLADATELLTGALTGSSPVCEYPEWALERAQQLLRSYAQGLPEPWRGLLHELGSIPPVLVQRKGDYVVGAMLLIGACAKHLRRPAEPTERDWALRTLSEPLQPRYRLTLRKGRRTWKWELSRAELVDLLHAILPPSSAPDFALTSAKDALRIVDIAGRFPADKKPHRVAIKDEVVQLRVQPLRNRSEDRL